MYHSLWRLSVSKSDRFAPIRSLGDYTHVRLTSDEPNDSLANEGMVVNRQNPNQAGIATHDFIGVPLPENFLDNLERPGDVA